MAVEKEYIESNPADITARRRGNGNNEAEPGILTVEQARRLLKKVSEDAPETVPCIALGLRTDGEPFSTSQTTPFHGIQVALRTEFWRNGRETTVGTW